MRTRESNDVSLRASIITKTSPWVLLDKSRIRDGPFFYLREGCSKRDVLQTRHWVSNTWDSRFIRTVFAFIANSVDLIDRRVLKSFIYNINNSKTHIYRHCLNSILKEYQWDTYNKVHILRLDGLIDILWLEINQVLGTLIRMQSSTILIRTIIPSKLNNII